MGLIGSNRVILNDRLIIGIDFGTTFSGVAYCYSETPGQMEIVRDWHGGSGIGRDKVPSILSYDQGFKWGYQIKPDQIRIEYMKLCLDKQQSFPIFASKEDSAKAIEAAGRTVIEAVAEYLGALYKHALGSMNVRLDESLVRNTEKQFIVTVPALWSDAAKHATMIAAKQAGLDGDIKMISEPEAAAYYTLKQAQSNNLVVGNIIVVCDAGGGTVDLISYRISNMQPLELEEVSKGTGGLCGAAFLNHHFEEQVKGHLGNSVFENMIEKKPITWRTASARFEESIKRNFGDDSEESFWVPFPGIPELETGFMIFTPQEVKKIFDPVVEDVIALIQGQVTAVQKCGKSVNAILLVGGFGESKYLHQRVEAYFKEGNPPLCSSDLEISSSSVHSSAAGGLQKLRMPSNSGNGSNSSSGDRCLKDSLGNFQTNKIHVKQPINGWTAVVRGAVMCGLEGTIVTHRYSRYHYGVVCSRIYDPKIHPTKYWDKHDCLWRCKDAMRWYVASNEKISSARTIMFWFRKIYDGADFPGITELEQDLLACNTEIAPVIYDQGQMFRVCTLRAQIGEVPRECWRNDTTREGDEPYWQLNYTVEMKIDSAQLDFVLKVDGVDYGSVHASFDQ